MMKGWREVKIGDYCNVLSSKRVFASDYVEKGIPFYRSKEIIHKALGMFAGDEIYISEKKFNEFKSKFGAPVKGDILLSSVGNRSGIPYLIREEYNFYFKDGNLIWMRDFDDELSSKYLEYYLRSELGQRSIESMMIGAAQKALTIDGIKKIKINLPPLKTQCKIASILSAYDGLIENNLKRIKLLEEQVQQTYEEWFVRMKFPGYETAVFDEETELPEGWEEIDLNEHIKIKHGYAFKGEFFKLEETNRILLTPGNFRIGGGIKLNKLKYYDEQIELAQDYVLKKHDLLITMTDLSKQGDTLGYPLLVPTSLDKTYLHNQRLGKVIPKNERHFPKYFLRMYFQDYRYRSFVVGSATGSTVKHTSPSKILFFKPQLPSFSGSLISQFDNFAKPLFETIDKLLLQQKFLKEARDILLPRLMTGMIDPSASLGQVVDGLEINEGLDLDSYREVAEGNSEYKVNKK